MDTFITKPQLERGGGLHYVVHCIYPNYLKYDDLTAPLRAL